MKYNNEETLSRAIRILGEETVQRYQYNSSSVNLYSKTQERVYIDNPMKVNLINYILLLTDCVVKLFRTINYKKAEVEGTNEFVYVESAAAEQLVDDIEYFKKIYEEDILQIKKDDYVPPLDSENNIKTSPEYYVAKDGQYKIVYNEN